MESINLEKQFLESLIKGIAALFGPNCEVVLHDHMGKSYDKTIVAIENGYITGRKVGDCGTNLGLEVLRGTDKHGDKYGYVTQLKNGNIIKSSSVYIRNSKNEVIGAICINFDITDLIVAEKAISAITGNPLTSIDKNGVNEVFANNVTEILESLVQESLNHVGKPVSHMNKGDKIEALKYLDEKGAFLIKKSGDRIAKFYDMSKYTMYSYLEEIRNGEE